jgi:protein-disulfide isomerase
MQWLLCAFLMFVQAPAQTNSSDDFLMGRSDSPVKIELFSDFQCPACRSFYTDTVAKLIAEYSAGGKVGLIFRDFPLEMHPIARVAARYAIASKTLGHEQWKKVIAYLYECQAEWTYDGKIEPVLSRILSPQEMDALRVAAKDPAIEKSIERNIALGNSKGITSTPTFFVTMGGKEQKVVNVLPLQTLKSFIEPNLK